MIFDEITSAYTSSGFYAAARNFYLKKPYQGIIMIDPDGLKRVNYVNGRDVGDALLKIIVREIYNVIPNGIVGRVGDDEFAVFVAETDSESRLAAYANSIVESARTVREVLGEMVLCTLTVGVMPIDSSQCEKLAFAEMMGLAEFALSGAKRAGGNRYMMYDREIVDKYRRTDNIKRELQNMINEDSAIYKFQPICDMRTRRTGGFEMLARMSAPGFENVSPAEFINIAREFNMIRYFDVAAMRCACETIKKLTAAGRSDVYISVNVSPDFFLSKDFYEVVTSYIDGSGIDTHMLVIELTEETFIASYDRAKDIIDKIAARGIRFYVDDFGTGYSNLSRLQEINMQVLKIDKSLIDRIEDSDSLVRKTIEIARIFDMKVVAEGIETDYQFDILKNLGCDMGQGYYIGRPMSYDDMINYLDEEKRAHQSL